MDGRSIGDRWRSTRWLGRTLLAERPWVYLPIARRKYPDSVVGEATELVIDGFTRSAVTFATIAFHMAQTRPVRVAHTLHAAAHILVATERGVPTLVAIREPEETVLSAVVREPYVSLDHALTAYTRFYSAIEPRRARFVVGEFEEITRDFGAVIRRVNERYGTSFDPFDHTPENVRTAYQIIDDRAVWPPWSHELGRFEAGIIGYDEYQRVVESYREAGNTEGLALPTHRVQRPMEGRERDKEQLRSRLADPPTRRLLDRARATYGRIVAGD